jgi:hypothetical protein
MKISQIKFKTLILLLLVNFAFTSCSKDDGEIPEPENQAPSNFNLINVADGATNVDLEPAFSWNAAIDPDGDAVSYDLYLGTSNPPTTLAGSNLNTTTYTPQDNLDFEASYYWKVVAKDGNQNKTETGVASFTIRDMTTEEAIVSKWFLESQEGQPAFTECKKNTFFHFKEGLVLQVLNYGKDGNGNCTETDDSTYSYKFIRSNHIEISDSSETVIWRIQSLTKTELVLDANGSTVTFKKE